MNLLDEETSSEFIHHKIMLSALDAQDIQEIVCKVSKLIGRKVNIQYPEQGNSLSLCAVSKPRRIPATPEFDLPTRFVCPISIKKELVGMLWINEEQHPLSNLDLRTIQSASIIVALHISQQRALASLEAQLGYSFLDSLLEDQFRLSPQALRRAELLGFDPEDIYSVGVIVIDSTVPLLRESMIKREQLAEKLKRMMQELKMPSVFSFIQNHIIFLIPERIDAEQIWKSIKAPDLAIVVSLLRHGFDTILQSYMEVKTIIPHISFGNFHHYQDLLVPRVLMGDNHARSSFIEKMFNPLKNSKNGDVHIRTLLTFAKMGFHLKNTANELKIHPKSLRYRLDRAISIGNFDLNDIETQFNLQLACRIIALN
jgi:PucR family transcriptional regulator, purine catabolism regulatory protein